MYTTITKGYNMHMKIAQMEKEMATHSSILDWKNP